MILDLNIKYTGSYYYKHIFKQLNKKLKEAGMVDRGISMIVQVIKNPKLKKQLLEVMKKAGIK